ncbi:hypothetical protein GGE65_008237 [Skermanella aerolata]|jgi:hypothetical protein|uniref:DUF3102 domain-containing protein n=1 Tax=Skermanella aerolata TaxID=393310 RepID=UPI003D243FE1
MKIGEIRTVKLDKPGARYGEEFSENGKVVFKSRESAVSEIHRLWNNAQQHFVSIGRWLNAAKDALPHGEYEQMVVEQLPFSPSIARQLRTAAEFVDSGIIPREQLPDSYATVYQIATLPKPILEEAKQKAMIRPSITRRELTELKRLHKSSSSIPHVDMAKLIERRRRLLVELLKIRRQMKDANSRI